VSVGFIWFPKSDAIATPIQLKTAHAYPSGPYQMNLIHEYWKEAVEKYTDGKVQGRDSRLLLRQY